MALLTVALFVGVRSYQMVRDAWHTHRVLEDAQKKMDVMMQQKQGLDAAILELDTPEAIERIAKEQLNLKKRGESVVVVPPVASSSSATSSSATVPLWRRIYSFFVHQ